MKELYERIFTTEEFADEFNRTVEYVRQCCRSQKLGAKQNKAGLPAGYSAFKEGRKWRIGKIPAPNKELLPSASSDLRIDRLREVLPLVLKILETQSKLLSPINQLLQGPEEEILKADPNVIGISIRQASEMLLRSALLLPLNDELQELLLERVSTGNLRKGMVKRSGKKSLERVLQQLDYASLLSPLLKESFELVLSMRKDGEYSIQVNSHNPFVKEAVSNAPDGPAKAASLTLSWLARLERSSDTQDLQGICSACGSQIRHHEKTKSKYCSIACKNRFDQWITDVRKSPRKEWLRRISMRLDLLQEESSFQK